MFEKLAGGLFRVVSLGERLDSSLVGEDYLHSIQKQVLDRYGARILIEHTAALVTMARFAIWLDDGSPTAIELPRVGRNGNIFMQRKLRSLVNGPKDSWPPVRAKHDPRVTRVGQILRRTSVDELPQLRNITRGDMSLVGPRPKTETEMQAFSSLDPRFRGAYILCSPGLTGLEQIDGRRDHTTPQRIELTRQYAAEACLALDLNILRKTIAVVCSGDGAY